MALTITILPVDRVMSTRVLITIVRLCCSFCKKRGPENFTIERDELVFSISLHISVSTMSSRYV